MHAPTIRSNVVQRSQVFVLRQDGIEESIELGDLVPLRVGQTITAVQGGVDPESGQLLLLHNHQSRTTFAEPLRPSSLGPLILFLVVLCWIWMLAGLFVHPLASALPVGQDNSASVQSSTLQPLPSIFKLRANQRYAQCLKLPHHQVPGCASYEKATAVGGTGMCSCKSVEELLDDTRAGLRHEAMGSPDQGNVGVAALIMIVVGGLGGIVAATYVYRRQMRSRRDALRHFLVEAAKEASQIAGIAMVANVDAGSVALAVQNA